MHEGQDRQGNFEVRITGLREFKAFVAIIRGQDDGIDLDAILKGTKELKESNDKVEAALGNATKSLPPK